MTARVLKRDSDIYYFHHNYYSTYTGVLFVFCESLMSLPSLIHLALPLQCRPCLPQQRLRYDQNCPERKVHSLDYTDLKGVYHITAAFLSFVTTNNLYQQTRELISARNTYHKYNNKDLSRLR